MKRLLVVLVIAMMVMTLAGCGSKQDPLVGKWVEDAEQGETIEFFSDGTGIMSDATKSYSISAWIAENDRLKITIQIPLIGETSVAYDYEIKGKTLTLIWDDGSVTYEKQN